MKEYRVTLKSGQYVIVPAARFESDGSGTRLFDSEGELVASWSDGQTTAVVDNSFAVSASADLD